MTTISRAIRDCTFDDNKPFVGDIRLMGAIDELLVDRTNIVETGTYIGATSCWFMKCANRIGIPFYTVEIDIDRARIAYEHDISPILLGDSASILRQIVALLRPKSFFFLDAHWGNAWPLEYELDIAGKIDDAVIVVHDFNDDSGVPYDPGNDLKGPAGKFLEMNSERFGLYVMKKKPRAVGVGMLCRPNREFKYWRRHS